MMNGCSGKGGKTPLYIRGGMAAMAAMAAAGDGLNVKGKRERETKN